MECGTRGIQVVPRRKLLVILGDVKDQKGGKEGEEDKNPLGQGEESRICKSNTTGRPAGKYGAEKRNPVQKTRQQETGKRYNRNRRGGEAYEGR